MCAIRLVRQQYVRWPGCCSTVLCLEDSWPILRVASSGAVTQGQRTAFHGEQAELRYEIATHSRNALHGGEVQAE